MHLQYFGLFCAADTASVDRFRGFVLRILPDSQCFGVRYCGYSCIVSFSGLCTAGTANTGSISCVGTVSTRSPKILSTCQVYSEYEVYLDHLCTVSISSCPLLCRKHSQMVPQVGVGAIYNRWGHLEDLGVLTVFRDDVPTAQLLPVFRGSGLRILAVFQVFRGLILRVLPVLGLLDCSYSQYSAVFGPSGLLILPVLAVFRPPILHYSQY